MLSERQGRSMLMIGAGIALASVALTAKYPDNSLAGMKPVVFASGTISSNANSEFGGNFHPNGSEYYFSRRDGGDGATDIAFFRPHTGTWHLAGIEDFRAVRSTSQPNVELSAAVDVVEVEFGQLGDILVPAATCRSFWGSETGRRSTAWFCSERRVLF